MDDLGARDNARVDGPESIELPLDAGVNAPKFGSDVIADTIRSLDIPYIAINPGASFRGLHDSLVNYLGNRTPQILLCLHEESAVAIAHGYAKVTGKPMLAVCHSNVGLMHASMAVFNAWCDRMPLILLGATGPVDAAKRRPWIDWLHTARDQGALVRHYTKWDDQPASPAAAQEALLRAAWLTSTAPMAPVYINLDAEIQEEEVTSVPSALDPKRFMPAVTSGVDEATVEQIAGLLKGAKSPVILMGRMSLNQEDWDNRVKLAEALGAKVITHKKPAAVFPTDHELHAGAPISFIDAETRAAIEESDLVLSLYWIDLAGTLKAACRQVDPNKTIIHVSVDHHIHNGWSMDHQAHPPADVFVPADPDELVARLLPLVENDDVPTYSRRADLIGEDEAEARKDLLSMRAMARQIRASTRDRKVTLLHTPTSWNTADWHYRDPLDYIGSDGGGGIGGGPGISVGAALALRGSDRLPLSIVGDGDYLMGVTALWTACHYNIPMLMVIANNQSFYNDEVHQQKVAQLRGRPVENKWIGQRMINPEIDLAAMAQAQGAMGIGPVRTPEELAEAMEKALAHVDAGGVAVIDARVIPGYTKAVQDAMAGTSMASNDRG